MEVYAWLLWLGGGAVGAVALGYGGHLWWTANAGAAWPALSTGFLALLVSLQGFNVWERIENGRGRNG